jgi:hypothetical protein
MQTLDIPAGQQRSSGKARRSLLLVASGIGWVLAVVIASRGGWLALAICLLAAASISVREGAAGKLFLQRVAFWGGVAVATYFIASFMIAFILYLFFSMEEAT